MSSPITAITILSSPSCPVSRKRSKVHQSPKVSCSPTTLLKVNSWISQVNGFRNREELSNLDNGHSDPPIEVDSVSDEEMFERIRPKKVSRFRFDLRSDNERKKELCSYLQLMKPTERKSEETSQYRRSPRVKNITEKQKEEISFTFPKPRLSLGRMVVDFDPSTEVDWWQTDNPEQLSPPPAIQAVFNYEPQQPSTIQKKPYRAIICSPIDPVKERIIETTTKSSNLSSPIGRDSPLPSYHSIEISLKNGPVIKIFYTNYNLVISQDNLVSAWTQTASGHILGSQNMWIERETIARLSMNDHCLFKESLDMILSADNNLAYIELWSKEHKSEHREVPMADVFAVVYFWPKAGRVPGKKVLQLDNIKGFADDVQYTVLKSSLKIIVSWHLATSTDRNTFVHCYNIAEDFTSISSIIRFEGVQHYVSSLHNIEGCASLIMGCGENKITLWNIKKGRVASNIEMLGIRSPLSTLWVKCDRGFLFTLQQCLDKELRLIAINGINHSWKKLASYKAPKDLHRLKGVCVDSGLVLACYDSVTVCWNAQTCKIIKETAHSEIEFIAGKFIIQVRNGRISLRRAIAHLLNSE